MWQTFNFFATETFKNKNKFANSFLFLQRASAKKEICEKLVFAHRKDLNFNGSAKVRKKTIKFIIYTMMNFMVFFRKGCD